MIETFFVYLVIAVFVAYLLTPRKEGGRTLPSPRLSTKPPPEPPKPKPISHREELAEGRDHLTVTGNFQSDKYLWCPAGFVPLKLTDPAARDLLDEYGRRRGAIDPEFQRDLLEALNNVPTKPNAGYKSFETVQVLQGKVQQLQERAFPHDGQ